MKNLLRNFRGDVGKKSLQRIYALAFVMGALPFLLVVLLQVAQYAFVILLVCVILGIILRLVRKEPD